MDQGSQREEVGVLRVFGLRKNWIVGVVGVAVLASFTAVGFASPPSSGFVSTVLATGKLANMASIGSAGITLQTSAPTNVRVQRVDIGPGGSSGWHHHPGIVVVVVASGATTLMKSDCSSVTYGPGLPAGAVFVESGDGAVQASSVDGATNYVTFVAPNVTPPVFRIDDPVPACAGG
jgi:hypothetical protein